MVGASGPRARSRWDMQRAVLARMRALGIVPVLPAFQGNVPPPLLELHPHANITLQKARSRDRNLCTCRIRASRAMERLPATGALGRRHGRVARRDGRTVPDDRRRAHEHAHRRLRHRCQRRRRGRPHRALVREPSSQPPCLACPGREVDLARAALCWHGPWSLPCHMPCRQGTKPTATSRLATRRGAAASPKTTTTTRWQVGRCRCRKTAGPAAGARGGTRTRTTPSCTPKVRRSQRPNLGPSLAEPLDRLHAPRWCAAGAYEAMNKTDPEAIWMYQARAGGPDANHPLSTHSSPRPRIP